MSEKSTRRVDVGNELHAFHSTQSQRENRCAKEGTAHKSPGSIHEAYVHIDLLVVASKAVIKCMAPSTGDQDSPRGLPQSPQDNRMAFGCVTFQY